MVMVVHFDIHSPPLDHIMGVLQLVGPLKLVPKEAET
jgi:hypothetical protein